MPSVLEDLARGDLTNDEVEDRLADWHDRLTALYDRIESWLPEGWTATRRLGAPLDEAMLRAHQMGPRRWPELVLSGPAGREVVLRPAGLWILGTNGRVDIDAPSGRWRIADKGDGFIPLADGSQPARWFLYRPGEIPERREMTEEKLKSVLSQ